MQIPNFSSAKRWAERWAERWWNFSFKTLEPLALLSLTALFISRWLERFQIWPDSANYLTAALNFAQKGTLLVNLNWPLLTLDFKPQYLSTYPPGYALYLSVFALFTQNPIHVAAIGQTFVLILFLLTLWKVSVELEFPPFLRLAFLAFLYKFEAFRDVSSSLLTEALYITLTAGVFLFTVRLIQAPHSKKLWLWSLSLLLFASTVRWNGFSNASFFLLPLLALWPLSKKNCALAVVAISFCAFSPNLLWFLRNKLALDSATGFYAYEGILWHKALYPFQHTFLRWGFNSMWIFSLLFLVCLAPFFLKSHAAQKRWLLFQIWMGILVQFLAIYCLSLVLNITPVDDRYLSPSYTFLAILLFFAVSLMIRAAKKIAIPIQRWGFVIVGLVVPIMAMGSMARMQSNPFMRVEEENLWTTLKKESFFTGATHFYSDENWNHQIFSGIPQKILWPNLFHHSSAEIENLLGEGKRPFFVMNINSELFNKSRTSFEALRPKLEQKTLGNFQIFYLPATSPN